MPSQVQMMADRRLVEASAAIEVQLDKDAHRRPVLFLLKKAREAAVQATDALVFCDHADAAVVRQLQSEIRRYDELVAWVREIIIEGKEADQRLTEIEREEFAGILLDSEDDHDAGGLTES